MGKQTGTRGTAADSAVVEAATRPPEEATPTTRHHGRERRGSPQPGPESEHGRTGRSARQVQGLRRPRSGRHRSASGRPDDRAAQGGAGRPARRVERRPRAFASFSDHSRTRLTMTPADRMSIVALGGAQGRITHAKAISSGVPPLKLDPTHPSS
jgi:hypothetical protein